MQYTGVGRVSVAAVLVGLAFGSAPVSAQTAPSLTVPEPQKLPLAPGHSIEGPPSIMEAPPAGSEAVSLILLEVRLEGEAPPEVSVAPLWAPLLNQRITVATLYQLAAAVEQRYSLAGYPLIRVVVPRQDLAADGARVRLQLIDGVIGELVLEAVPGAYRAGVRRYLAPLVGQPRVRLGLLERQISLAAELAGLELKTSIGPGVRPGESALIVAGERRGFSALLSADNSLSRDLGSGQLTLDLGLNSVFEAGERLQLFIAGEPAAEGFRAESPRRFALVGSSVPVGADGWKLSAQHAVSKTQVLTSSGIIAGDLQRTSLAADYPIVLNRAGRVQFNTSLEWLDETLKAQSQAVALSKDRLTNVQVGLDGRFCTLANVCGGASVSLTGGLDFFGARTQADAAASGVPLSKAEASHRFRALGVGAEGGGPFADSRWAWRASVRGQYSMNATLPSSQLFSVVGPAAVSGLDAGAVSGDEGYVVRGEILAPPVRDAGVAGLGVMPYGVLAHGKASLAHPSALEQKSTRVEMAGLGVRFEHSVGRAGAFSFGSAEFARVYSSAPSAPQGGETRFSVRFNISF